MDAIRMGNEKINKKITKIWKDYGEEVSGKYIHILYSRFKRKRILFIGLNPSLSKKGPKRKAKYKKILEGTDYENCNINKLLARNSKDFKFLILENKKVNEKGRHPYFDKFHDIREHIGWPSYQHIDLFCVRTENQVKTKEMIKESKKNENFVLNDFAVDQLEIMVSMIKEINPKIIFVVNAFASDILNKDFNNGKGKIVYPNLFKINKETFEKKGYDILEINNKKLLKIPIIFSSMLTGQRALDKYSYKRLKWFIKKIIK